MAIILLENLRSILNVGSIFRLADATGIEKILLIGYTPTPTKRTNQENVRLSKTALGAEKTVPWEQYATTAEALAAYPDHTPVVVERTERSVNYNTETPEHPLYIFGNEVDGVEQATMDAVQKHIHLPMKGFKGSINVATAVAVILYDYTNR